MKRAAVLVCLLALALTAPAADASIVVKKSIAGVRLGMSRDAVLKRLGTPTARYREVWGVAEEPTPMWSYRARQIRVVFWRERVSEVSTTSPRQKTARGLGVGSSYDAVRGTYRSWCKSAQACFIGIDTSVESLPFTWFVFQDEQCVKVTLTYSTP